MSTRQLSGWQPRTRYVPPEHKSQLDDSQSDSNSDPLSQDGHRGNHHGRRTRGDSSASNGDNPSEDEEGSDGHIGLHFESISRRGRRNSYSRSVERSDRVGSKSHYDEHTEVSSDGVYEEQSEEAIGYQSSDYADERVNESMGRWEAGSTSDEGIETAGNYFSDGKIDLRAASPKPFLFDYSSQSSLESWPQDNPLDSISQGGWHGFNKHMEKGKSDDIRGGSQSEGDTDGPYDGDTDSNDSRDAQRFDRDTRGQSHQKLYNKAGKREPTSASDGSTEGGDDTAHDGETERSAASLKAFISDDSSQFAHDDELYSESSQSSSPSSAGGSDESDVRWNDNLSQDDNPLIVTPPDLTSPADMSTPGHIIRDVQQPSHESRTSLVFPSFIDPTPGPASENKAASTSDASYELFAGYQNYESSCWLDSSLTSLRYITHHDFADFTARFDTVPPESTLFSLWIVVGGGNRDPTQHPGAKDALLSQQRDDFRKALSTEKGNLVRSVISAENAFAWLSALLRNYREQQGCDGVQQYFLAFFVKIRECQRCCPDLSKAPVDRLSLTKTLTSRSLFIITPQICDQIGGHVSHWVQSLLSSEPPLVQIGCWRRSEDGSCSGSTVSRDIFVSIPVILTIEVELDGPSTNADFLDFPDHMTILPAAISEGQTDVTYDLAGRIFYSMTLRHYITRVLWKDAGGTTNGIMDHDGLHLGGKARRLKKAEVQSHLAGQHTDLADVMRGYRTAYVLYHLRGGMKAQSAYLSHQLAHLRSKYHIDTSTTELASLSHSIFDMNLTASGYSEASQFASTSRFREYELTTSSSTPSPIPDLKAELLALSHKMNRNLGSPIEISSATSDGESAHSQPTISKRPSTLGSRKSRTLVPRSLASPPHSIMAPKNFERGGLPSKRTARQATTSLHTGGHKSATMKRQRESSDIILSSNLSSASPSSEPLLFAPYPGTVVTVHCRCGATGNSLDLLGGLAAIRCNDCLKWSHVSCQRQKRGETSPMSTFVCHECSWEEFESFFHRNSSQSNTPHEPGLADDCALLSQRLRAGKGVLMSRGAFWYPARLLHRFVLQGQTYWLLRPWRFCEFQDKDATPHMLLAESDLVDELWDDTAGRRKIRLGKWIHATTLPTDEDLLINPHSCPYTLELDAVLSPELESMSSLFQAILSNNAEGIDAKQYPVLTSKTAKPKQNGKKNKEDGAITSLMEMVSHYGDLNIADQAGIHNWIWHKVPGASESIHSWIARVLPAHAATLLIASRLRHVFEQEAMYPRNSSFVEQRNFILSRAWEHQRAPHRREHGVDVDRECISLLEERMFEQSAAAGIAGLYQWGLDAGDHQRQWNPYAGLPEHWKKEGRPLLSDDENELQLGEGYIIERPLTPPASKKRPAPKPKTSVYAKKRKLETLNEETLIVKPAERSLD